MDQKNILEFALPDGHLMNHVLPFLKKAGVRMDGYDESSPPERRPRIAELSEGAATAISSPDRVAIKVIRPQDMPTHVANGNFDLALSGLDWLAEHKRRFPNSPLDSTPLLRLGFGKVRIVAAVHRDNGEDLDAYIRSFRGNDRNKYIRIASEYVYLADAFAHEYNLHPYRIIMTYGATESLIPEDSDMIIENTETGNTLRKNNLVPIHVLMESEGCLIVNRESMENSFKHDLILGIKTLFEQQLPE